MTIGLKARLPIHVCIAPLQRHRQLIATYQYHGGFRAHEGQDTLRHAGQEGVSTAIQLNDSGFPLAARGVSAPAWVAPSQVARALAALLRKSLLQKSERENKH